MVTLGSLPKEILMKNSFARVLLAGAMMFGPIAPLGSGSAQAQNPPIKLDNTNQLAKVSVPHRPCCLTWSADGVYVAGDAWAFRSTKERLEWKLQMHFTVAAGRLRG